MDKEFLMKMLQTNSVSGGEIELQRKMLEHIKKLGFLAQTDPSGNVYARLNPEKKLQFMLCGHIDEIGYRVTHIDDQGYIHVGKAGYVRFELAQGKRCIIKGKKDVPAVMGLILEKGEVKKDPQLNELYLDAGFKSREDALRLVTPGDFVTYSYTVDELENNRLAARACDNRLGAFAVIEALARAREKGASCGLAAVTTVGEETTMRGAYYAANRLKPACAIAVDVMHTSDYAGFPPERFGKIDLGGGPVLCHSSFSNEKINKGLEEAAARLKIKLQIEVACGVSGTDADKTNQSFEGIPSTTFSIPLRYMHSPSEVCSLNDVEETIEVLAEFLSHVDEEFNPDPFQE